MRALVIGLGSIGKRHVEILQSIDFQVSTVSRRSGQGDFTQIGQAVEHTQPDYVVVATETSARSSTLAQLDQCGYDGRLLVEKPLGEASIHTHALDRVYIGYNLRFHPVATRLRAVLADEQLLSVQARVGQYLPHWRPGRDYRQTASAVSEGGVLRDLSHELDLFGWMFGPCRKVTALAGRGSSLDLNVDETVACLASYERAPILSAEMNYCDRTPQRWMTVTTDRHTFEADIIAGTLAVDGDQVMAIDVDRNQPYRDMHIDATSTAPTTACSAREGRTVMQVINAMESSITTGSSVLL